MPSVTSLVIPLASPEANLSVAGGKGANLSLLLQSGFLVPNGFIITTAAYDLFCSQQMVSGIPLKERIIEATHHLNIEDIPTIQATSARIREWFTSGKILEDIHNKIDEAYLLLGKPPVAVRSSATAEDLPDFSFAGQQETYLNVIGESSLTEAVLKCWASLWTERAIAYRLSNNLSNEDVSIAVVVKVMVASEAAGVMFTVNPVSGLRSETVIDATLGLGDPLVAGRIEPDHYVVSTTTSKSPQIISRHLGAKATLEQPKPEGGVEILHSDHSTDQALTDDQILSLTGLGELVAQLFNSPQDIEWALQDGQIYLLQSRPITTIFPLPEGISQDKMMVLISFGALQGILDPITTMGKDGIFSLFSRVANLMGYPVTIDTQNALREAAGRLFINITPLLKNRIGRFIAPRVLSVVEPASRQGILPLLDDPRLAPGTKPISFRTVTHLGRVFVPVLFRIFLTLALPDSRRKVIFARTNRQVKDFQALARDAETLEQVLVLDRTFLLDAPVTILHYLLPGVAAGMASFYRLNALASRVPGGKELVMQIMRGIPHNVTTQMDLALWESARQIQSDPPSLDEFQKKLAPALAEAYMAGTLPQTAQSTVAHFMDQYGMRGVGEIDIGRVRWREDPTPVMQSLQSYIRITDPAQAPDILFQKGAAKAEEAIDKLITLLRAAPHGRLNAHMARLLAYRVRALAGIRELPKFFGIRLMGIARQKLCEQGQALASKGLLDMPTDIFHLYPAELQAFVNAGSPHDTPSYLAQVASERREYYEREKRRKQVPRVLTSDGLTIYEGLRQQSLGDSQLSGENILTGSPVSPGVSQGRVRVVLDPHTTQLLPGEILVCPGTDPAWTPLFMTAVGLVMEVGGMMTHGSVIAREYGIPGVVGVHQATQRLKTGQLIRMDGSLGKIEIMNPETASDG